jgi:hypothetical protein
MRLIASRIAVLMAATLFSALPVLAEESTGMGMASEQGMQRDDCLLVSQNCRDSVDSIQQRIERLQREISKGSSAYSSDELRQLNSQLERSNELMRSLVEGGGG